MINTTQTTTYNLTLTAEQFDALHELLDETIAEYSSDLDLDLVNLNDIEIYQVWQQMNSNKSEPQVTNSDDNYGDKVDTLVSNMAASNDKEFTHDSEGC